MSSSSQRRVCETVYHSGRTPRGPGGAVLYAYGYRDLSEALGCSLAEVVEAVTTGTLDPLDLPALHRLRSDAAKLGPRPASVEPRQRETRLVVLSHVLEREPPIYGLGDRWAFGYGDLATFVGRTINAVRIAATGGGFDPRSLGDVLGYVGGRRAARRSAGERASAVAG